MYFYVPKHNKPTHVYYFEGVVRMLNTVGSLTLGDVFFIVDDIGDPNGFAKIFDLSTLKSGWIELSMVSESEKGIEDGHK